LTLLQVTVLNNTYSVLNPSAIEKQSAYGVANMVGEITTFFAFVFTFTSGHTPAQFNTWSQLSTGEKSYTRVPATVDSGAAGLVYWLSPHDQQTVVDAMMMHLVYSLAPPLSKNMVFCVTL
jgi:hypothetical protein